MCLSKQGNEMLINDGPIENVKSCSDFVHFNKISLLFECFHLRVTVLCEIIQQQVRSYLISTLEHLLLFSLFYVIVCAILYRLYNRGHRLRYEKALRPAKNVLFVIAHPDDECMFFGPSIYKLCQDTNTNVHLLCLSTGNHDNLGYVRRKELWDSCQSLGICASNVILYNCTLLPDNPHIKWRTDVVAKIILRHIEALNIDTLVTFDKNGVSRHANHSSLYYALAYLKIEKFLPQYCKVYTLESINILRKYWLIFDIPLSFILSTHRYMLNWKQKDVIISAMKQHKSQFVWFRKLYVSFSRYIIINTFQQLDMVDLELELSLDE